MIGTSSHLGSRVQLHGLVSAASHNGRYGVVVDDAAPNGRYSVRLGAEEFLSIKPANLDFPATPSCGCVLIGADEPAGAAVLEHALSQRLTLLTRERGCHLPILALIGRSGVVHAPKRATASEVFRPWLPGAPFGGLADASLQPATRRELSACEGFRANNTPYRRIGVALKLAAAPSVVLIDVSAEGAALRLLRDGGGGGGGDFCLERHGGTCVVVGAAAAQPDDPPWLTRLPRASTPAEVLTAALESFTGWLLPLVPPLPSVPLNACLVCTAPQAEPRVCSGCHCACYCGPRCQLAELTDDRAGALPHAACCDAFRSAARRTGVRVELPGRPTWLDAAMSHDGRARSECQLLALCGVHVPPYTLFCDCSPVHALDSRLAPTEGGGGGGGDAVASALAMAALQPAVLPPQTGPPPAVPLASWAEYYEHRRIPTDSPISILLSFPLTVYHALQCSGVLERRCDGSERGDDGGGGGDDGGGGGGGGGEDHRPLRVHYLGAASREAALAPLFAELAELLPASRIQLHMIGNNAEPNAETSRFEGRDGGWVELSWHRAVCHESGLEPPDLAIGCNAGIAEYGEIMVNIVSWRGLHMAAGTCFIGTRTGCRRSAGLWKRRRATPPRCLTRAPWYPILTGPRAFSVPWPRHPHVRAHDGAGRAPLRRRYLSSSPTTARRRC